MKRAKKPPDRYALSISPLLSLSIHICSPLLYSFHPPNYLHLIVSSSWNLVFALSLLDLQINRLLCMRFCDDYLPLSDPSNASFAYLSHGDATGEIYSRANLLLSPHLSLRIYSICDFNQLLPLNCSDYKTFGVVNSDWTNSLRQHLWLLGLSLIHI